MISESNSFRNILFFRFAYLHFKDEAAAVEGHKFFKSKEVDQSSMKVDFVGEKSETGKFPRMEPAKGEDKWPWFQVSMAKLRLSNWQ